MRWISDHEYLHKSQGSVFLYDVLNNNQSEFLSKNTFDRVNAYDYQLSADRKYVAFMSNHSKLWRHSFTASYSIYDMKENPKTPAERVTVSGEENLIFNGIPDWVYEEEMFSSAQGFWWSPGGKYVAFAHFNDSEVPNIEYTWFGHDQYPRTISIRYPKAGANNPTVKLFVVDTDNVTDITEVFVPASFSSSEHYLATVTWVTDDRLAVQWLKRVQTHLILQIYDFTGSSWDPSEVKHGFSPMSGSFMQGKTTPITSGDWEVISILKVTEDKMQIKDEESTCLTCAINRERCQYISAYFSHNASYYRMSCSGPGIPYHSLMDNKNGEVKVLEGNDEFSSLISDIGMPTMRRGSIEIDGFDLWYQMFLPPGFQESKKYPLLIDVYAGPCSQKVDFAYRVGWSTYLASTEKVIVASFDGRGSGYQGDEIMHKIYKRLGTYEVEDQITAARNFINMGFIDKDRVAIWGWSYGGYVTSMALGAGSGVFKCGMAVAPVSKWKYYGIISIFKQHFYLQNHQMTERAKNFHSVQYLLVHGTADDNVHFQQAAEISEALVNEQVDFEAMWYTDKDHGLGGSAYQHVYTHMSHFLQRCFA
uniref:Dipeptidyl peptidase 4-like n=1 Tax=Sphaeramia orbicularis TaxID=375764 RepID=A0A673A636_9TELE